jgi:hypothetical protein
LIHNRDALASRSVAVIELATRTLGSSYRTEIIRRISVAAARAELETINRRPAVAYAQFS